jgi:hypothetical protein
MTTCRADPRGSIGLVGGAVTIIARGRSYCTGRRPRHYAPTAAQMRAPRPPRVIVLCILAARHLPLVAE